VNAILPASLSAYFTAVPLILSNMRGLVKRGDACCCLAIALRASQHLSDLPVLSAFDAHLSDVLALRPVPFAVVFISVSKTSVTNLGACKQRSLHTDVCE
jgi:hypothetical protein